MYDNRADDSNRLLHVCSRALENARKPRVKIILGIFIWVIFDSLFDRYLLFIYSFLVPVMNFRTFQLIFLFIKL